MKKCSIALPEDLLVELQAIARRESKSQSEVIREALAEYVTDNERGKPRPKSFGMASSGRIQAADLEDWLAETWERDW